MSTINTQLDTTSPPTLRKGDRAWHTFAERVCTLVSEPRQVTLGGDRLEWEVDIIVEGSKYVSINVNIHYCLRPLPPAAHKATRIVQSRKARSTGTQVDVIDNRDQSFAQDGAWLTLCVDHGGICSHENRRYATAWASEPEVWCEGCCKL